MTDKTKKGDGLEPTGETPPLFPLADRLYTAPALAAELGVKIHELDAWVGLGYLTPADLHGAGKRGARIFTGAQVAAGRIMAELRQAGLDNEAAGRIGSALWSTGAAQLGRYTISNGRAVE